MSLEQHNDSLDRILIRDGYQKLARELQDEIGEQMSTGNNCDRWVQQVFVGLYMDRAKAINVRLGLDSDDK